MDGWMDGSLLTGTMVARRGWNRLFMCLEENQKIISLELCVQEKYIPQTKAESICLHQMCCNKN
jgi:hypothetical protein